MMDLERLVKRYRGQPRHTGKPVARAAKLLSRQSGGLTPYTHADCPVPRNQLKQWRTARRGTAFQPRPR